MAKTALAAGEKRSDLAIFIDQFLNAPVALLGASAVISVMTGGAVDAAVIMGVVLINGMIGFVTERQSEKAIASLAKTGVREVTVLRDGVSKNYHGRIDRSRRHPDAGTGNLYRSRYQAAAGAPALGGRIRADRRKPAGLQESRVHRAGRHGAR